jgi:hypothetical protein
MSRQSKNDLEATKRLMGALVRMPPKPHDEMKVGRKPMKDLPNKRTRNLGKVDTKPTEAKTKPG